MSLTQTPFIAGQSTANPAFINPVQVPAEDALAYISKLIEAGEVVALIDNQGFAMFQSVDTLRKSFNEYPAGTGKFSMSRGMMGRKLPSGKNAPIGDGFEVTSLSDSPLQGVIFGSIRMSINNLNGDLPELPAPEQAETSDAPAKKGDAPIPF